ncbi:hypothetical protein BMS3Abin02_01248 [bacterium BMS3Abin02]|nr:hypothetical protein BMS3Abin02_01248 [bacterium BMS3Abin02]HDL49815.1 hypothetical protein [Actinomycetota bacterium]
MTIRIRLQAGAGGGVLADVLGRDLLASQAGWRIFERGLGYVAHGCVTGLEATDAKATATVVGTRPYEVSIELDATALTFDCTCPMGQDEEFCKHLVAVGLTVAGVDDARDDDVVPAESDGLGPVREWLKDQPAERLRDLLVDQAARDPEAHRRLSVLAAAEGGGPIDLDPYRAAIAVAFSVGDFDRYGHVDYRDAWEWRKGVEAVINDLEELLAAGFGAETVDLAEEVLRELNDGVEYVDDSDGYLYELFEQTMELHLAACHQARPDPVALAGRLFDWASCWELDRFLDAVADYAQVLGEEGLAAYRRLAEQRWRTVPALGPRDDSHAGFSERYRITRIMESLAETTGGLDELLEVMQHDQASGYAFVRMAEACRRHRRDDLALEWAQRGFEMFPGEWRLAELICDLHADAGRNAEALSIARDLFAHGPSLARYQRLQALAEAADEWPAEREPALAAVRGGIEAHRRDAAPRRFPRQGDDGSVLVEILLWENDADVAWEAAQTYGCNEQFWLHLAAARGERHPADALEVYRRYLDVALQTAKNRAYDEVVRLLETMRPLYVAVGRDDKFDALVVEIRRDYKRRRNLIERLDRARL